MVKTYVSLSNSLFDYRFGHSSITLSEECHVWNVLHDKERGEGGSAGCIRDGHSTEESSDTSMLWLPYEFLSHDGLK